MREPHPDCTDPLEWYRASYGIASDRAARLDTQIADANARANWTQECAIVALRLLRDAGRLTPRTDDERAVLRWAESLPMFHTPGANRRLALPMGAPGEHPDDREAYIERATAEAQIALDLGEAA